MTTVSAFEAAFRIPTPYPSPDPSYGRGLVRIGWMNDITAPPTVGLCLTASLGATTVGFPALLYGVLQWFGGGGGTPSGIGPRIPLLYDKWYLARVEHVTYTEEAIEHYETSLTLNGVVVTETEDAREFTGPMGLGVQIHKTSSGPYDGGHGVYYQPKVHVDFIGTTLMAPDRQSFLG